MTDDAKDSHREFFKHNYYESPYRSVKKCVFVATLMTESKTYGQLLP